MNTDGIFWAKRIARWLVALLIICVLACAAGCWYPSITGTVVDDETGKPIEGAIVYAQITRQQAILGLSRTKDYFDTEVLTDAKGEFYIKTPWGGGDYPEMAIYKPGYLGWSSRGIYNGTTRTGRHPEFVWKTGQVYRLWRFKPGMSYIEHFSHMSWALGGNSLLRKAMDEEEKQKLIRERSRRDRERDIREMQEKMEKEKSGGSQ